MKRYILRRILGITLAAVLIFENGMPTIAAQTNSVEEQKNDANIDVYEDHLEIDEKSTNETSIEEEAENHTQSEGLAESTTAKTEEIFSEEQETIEAEYYNGKSNFTQQRSVEAPTSLAVADKTETTITLLWSTVKDIYTYKIYRSASENSGYELLQTIQTDSNWATYTDVNYKKGEVYYYKVLAEIQLSDGTVIDSPFSDLVCSDSAIQNIVLNKSELNLVKGGQDILKATFVPEYYADSSQVVWSSNNESVATVYGGKVTAVGTGTTCIVATVGNIQTTCVVNVSVPVQQVIMSQSDITLNKGNTDTLSVKLFPEDTTAMKDVKWESSNTDVILVEGQGEQAVLRAVGVGESDIIVQCGEQTASCYATVIVPVTKVQLSEKSIELLENDDSYDVKISILPEDTTEQKINWSLDNEQLVDCRLVDDTLNIQSKGILGNAILTVTVGNKSAQMSIRVVEEKEDTNTDAKEIPVNKVQIEAQLFDDEEESIQGVINLKMGDESTQSATVTAKVLPEDATNSQISWKSSNTSVVRVSDAGVITAVGIGRATVTASAANGVSDSISVVVLAKEQNFAIAGRTEVVLYSNETLPAVKGISKTYQIILEDIDSKECSFRSSDESIATVNEDGLITAVAPGLATITVLDEISGKYRTVTVRVKNIVEDVSVARDEITVIKGSKVEIAFQVTPGNVSSDTLATLSFAKGKKSPITIDENWTKNKTAGIVKFTADEVGDAQIIITAGDKYKDKYNENVTILSVQKKIFIHVVPDTSTKIASIRLTGASSMKSGTEQMLDTLVKDDSGNELDSSKVSIGYTSSDNKIVTIDQQGNVKALKGGKAVITVYAMDGSNKKATYTINVQQRPSEIVFGRDIYGVVKAVGKTANISLKPGFIPADTAANLKGVNWSISKVLDENGNAVNDNPSQYFQINSSGVVTVQKDAVDGMRAIVVCSSKAYESGEDVVTGQVTVLVQQKNVNAVKFNQSNIQVVGLKQHEIPYTATFISDHKQVDFTATSSDNSIAEVLKTDNGIVNLQAYKYGTVTLNLCADNMITTATKVTIYPVEKGGIAAEKGSYLLQQAQYDGTDRAELHFVDSKTRQTVIDSSLFTYQSSNPDIVYVDTNGVAYANPKSDGKIVNGKNVVTITATLKDDPDKRKVTTKVVVCPTEQIERMGITYYESTSQADSDKNNTKGKTLTDNGLDFLYSQSNQNIVLRVTSYGAKNNIIKNPQLNFSSSDTNIATVKSQTKKIFGSGDGKYEVWEAVITVKRAGRFSIKVNAKDQAGYNRSIALAACAGEPILINNNVGTFNKNKEITDVNGEDGIASDSIFTVLPSDGTKIQKISVAYADLKISNSGKNQTVRLMKAFHVESLGNNQYQLIIQEKQLGNALNGTYNIVLNVTRSAVNDEDTGFGEPQYVTNTLQATYKVDNALPKVNNIKITLNSFIRGDAVKLPINIKEEIESISSYDDYMSFAEDIKFEQEDGNWYAKIKNEESICWKKSAVSEKIKIKLKGYKQCIVTNLYITIKEIRPVIKQQTVPAISLNQKNYCTEISLIDANQKIWTDYNIKCKDDNFTVVCLENGKTEVTLTNTILKAKQTTYTQKVLVSKPEWSSAIEVPISVKVYNKSAVPTVNFAKSTININRNINENSAQTDVKVSLNNVELKQGEWEILDTCKYQTKEQGKTIWKQCRDVFKVVYEEGRVKVSLKSPDNIPNGTYKLMMTKIWDEAYDKELKQPLKTANLTVVIKNTVPVVNVKMSGKLDLVNRSTSTLQGVVSVTNTNSSVSKIRLVNTNINGNFANQFYCTGKGNTFTLYARNNAELYAKSIKGCIEVTLSDGTVLPLKEINFTPTQKIPKVNNLNTQIVYKSADTQTVDFNFNQGLDKGIKISKIVATTLPKGISAQDSNGHLLVTVADKTLKAGKYKITVNVYFKGAQPVKGNVLGSPVTKTIVVEVKE